MSLSRTEYMHSVGKSMDLFFYYYLLIITFKQKFGFLLFFIKGPIRAFKYVTKRNQICLKLWILIVYKAIFRYHIPGNHTSLYT